MALGHEPVPAFGDEPTSRMSKFDATQNPLWSDSRSAIFLRRFNRLYETVCAKDGIINTLSTEEEIR